MVFKNRNMYTILIFVVLSLAFFNITMLYNAFRISNTENKLNEANNDYILLSIQHESNPTLLPSDNSTLSQFINIYESLNESDQYDYYEVYQQPLYILESGEFFDYNDNLHSDNEPTPCVQVSENVLYDFDIFLLEGRSLSGDDFILYKDASIPILLGYDYRPIYEIGYIFEANYLFTSYNFEVVGFLGEGSSIDKSNGSIVLDKYLVIPSVTFEYSPQGEDEYATHKIHYANKTSGILKVMPSKHNSVQDDIEQLLTNTAVGDYSWYSSNAILTNPIFGGLTLMSLKILSGGVAAVLLVLLVVLFIMYYRHTSTSNRCYEKLKVNTTHMLGIFVLSNIASAILIYLFVSFDGILLRPFCFWNILIGSAFFAINILLARNAGIRGSGNSVTNMERD